MAFASGPLRRATAAAAAAAVAASATRATPAAADAARALPRFPRHFLASAHRRASLSWDELRPQLAASNLHELLTRASLREDEWLHPGGVGSFWLLRHADTPADAITFDPEQPLGEGPNEDVLACVAQQRNVLYGAKSRSNLPVTVASRLVAAAAAKTEHPIALVPLPDLCRWVRDGQRWSDEALVAEHGSEAAEAAQAIALGRPRPGHSVLGQGTFKAAEGAWMHLAREHMEANEEVMQEMLAFKGALRGTFEPVHLADTDPEYMALAGGAMAALRS